MSVKGKEMLIFVCATTIVQVNTTYPCFVTSYDFKTIYSEGISIICGLQRQVTRTQNLRAVL